MSAATLPWLVMDLSLFVPRDVRTHRATPAIIRATNAASQRITLQRGRASIVRHLLPVTVFCHHSHRKHSEFPCHAGRSSDAPRVVASGRAGEDGPPGAVQSVEVDVLDRQQALMVAVELAAPGGAPDVGPVRGPVAGAGEAVALHEDLGEHRRVAVAACQSVGSRRVTAPRTAEA